MFLFEMWFIGATWLFVNTMAVITLPFYRWKITLTFFVIEMIFGLVLKYELWRLFA